MMAEAITAPQTTDDINIRERCVLDYLQLIIQKINKSYRIHNNMYSKQLVRTTKDIPIK